MEKTLLIGDHLVVDRITLAPPSKWMPLVHYREPRRGDVVVFLKPVADPDPVDGSPTYPYLVKRLVGVSRRPYTPARRHCDPERRGAGPAPRSTDDT